ncbi:hypothetical protein [Aurantiacibacter sp. D1-12]|uniref:hypothetical protein n=1 Tax=Aurantiacibacter sp. D1-12 TaxID=2993658 RepID=UPI00237CD133|nr:hypothetical protein [Aurantiacibacter sp. D1-12]MDE1468259.1 hypothetical protein [Aurantiacibacter sp. D1-12]
MKRRSNTLAGKVTLAASATLLAVALPSSVFAIGLLNGDSVSTDSTSQFAFTPAAADPAVAALIAEQSGGKARMMRFTPAGVVNSGAERSVTVAVRVDQQAAEALAVRSGIGADAPSTLQVAPTRYNLGLARGFGSFARPAPARTPMLSSTLSNANIPDISDFSLPENNRDEPSRFAARVEMEQTPVAGRREEARTNVSDQMLDVGGSYRLTRNLDITAGVRYEQDRDIVPLPDVEQQDSQAVYIGTQFRF